MRRNINDQHEKPQSSSTSTLNLQSLLYHKYSSSEYDYTYICTHNLIFNEKCQIVSVFKDFLIYDDTSEFLRRFYILSESDPRLNRVLAFYETYSKIFPNYMILPEAEHLYRNIRKKQKMIDAMNSIKQEEEENRKNLAITQKTLIESYQSNCNLVFTPKINKSILKYQPSKINEQSNTESSVSISLMFKKFAPSLDISFTKYHQKDEDKIANDNSIEELMHIWNGKIVSNLPDCYINVQPKRPGNPFLSQQTPKNLHKRTYNYYYNENQNKNRNHTPFGNSTSIKSKSRRKLQKCPQSPCLSKNSSSNINVPQLKPLNNLNIITNNFQSIVIPQTNPSGGNTVININNNFFSCTEISFKKERNSRLQSASPSLVKKDKNNNQKSSSNLLSPKLAPQNSRKTIKREILSPLGSLNIQENDKNQSTMKTERTRCKRADSRIKKPKSVGKPSKQINDDKTRKDKGKSISKNNLSNSNYYLKQMRSPLRERELNREKFLTNEIKHKFKMFIERSKMKPLTNRGFSDSFSPKKNNNRNQSLSSISNSMQKMPILNYSQKNIESDLMDQIRVISNTKNRIFSPLSQTNPAPNEPHNTSIPRIKVNTKPFLQRNNSVDLRQRFKPSSNSCVESNYN